MKAIRGKAGSWRSEPDFAPRSEYIQSGFWAGPRRPALPSLQGLQDFLPSHAEVCSRLPGGDGHLEAHSAHPGPPGSDAGSPHTKPGLYRLLPGSSQRPMFPQGPRPASPSPAMGTPQDMGPAPCPHPPKVPLDPPQWGPKHSGHMGISGAKEMRKQTGVAEKAALCCFTR